MSLSRPLELSLRALWGHNLEVCSVEAETRPTFSAASLRLPVSSDFELSWAQASHAALHVALSPLPFEPGTLRPIQRALVGVLEDARVEALALAIYPGLRDAWAPFHDASPAQGDTAPALLGRLARALFDSTYEDPSSWVQRARGAVEALPDRTAEACRELASVLGNELGQLRLPFDPAAPSLEPAYRDDHRGLWREQPQAAQESQEISPDVRRATGGSRGSAEGSAAGSESAITRRYPEWDYVIGRKRADHAAIREHERKPSAKVAIPRALLSRTRTVLRRAHQRPRLRPRCLQGAELDLGAVANDAARRARGEGSDARLYRDVTQRSLHKSTLLLLDLSSSVVERELALLQGLSALVAAGAPDVADLAIDGFCSRGREDVLYERFGASPGGIAPDNARVGSTRLGPALRHATELLCARPAADKLLVVVTDGEPSDVDVFDERYLVEDARQARDEACRRGVRVVAWCLRGQLTRTQRRMFPGAREAQIVRRLDELPRLLRRAYSLGCSGPAVNRESSARSSNGNAD